MRLREQLCRSVQQPSRRREMRLLGVALLWVLRQTVSLV
jgi:hypothetical protein